MPDRGFLNRRRAQRAPVNLEASIVTMDAYLFFDLADLSATGAKLRGPDLPPPGKRGLFRLQAFETLCKVAWAKNGACGVAFDDLIPAQILADLRTAGSDAKVEIRISGDGKPAG